MTTRTATSGLAIAGLVLAAGESSRMGRDKALLPYRGRTFLETIVAKLREAGLSRVAVVLGHHADEIWRAVDLQGVEVVTNCDYLRGQTSSLQVGLAALDNRRFRREPGTPSPPAPLAEAEGRIVSTTEGAFDRKGPKRLDAVLLCLVDHPAFEPSTVSALVEALASRAAAVVIPTHGGQRGHPVLIARPLFKPLLALRADQGANSVIRAWRSQTQFVEVADSGILVDVDDPGAYSALD
ncbi:MAG TPA: nucleotidyltransferase family protein [Terriglobia bacterium]|nr:nucleotidyltransferase family protein [Terriglobia bacterium]